MTTMIPPEGGHECGESPCCGATAYQETAHRSDAMNQKDIHAYWDMIQQFMDVSGSLPDVPIFEPFRSRDLVTKECDERNGRDPFKWRKMSPESWQRHHEKTYGERLQSTNFHHPCILDAHIQGRGLPMPGEQRGAMLA